MKTTTETTQAADMTPSAALCIGPFVALLGFANLACLLVMI